MKCFITLLILLANPVLADPSPPLHAPEIETLQLGVFCAQQSMDRMPAPDTDAGWIHVPTTDIRFHWPDRQVVPAAIGLAFGVEVTGAPGWVSQNAQARIYRPGRHQPETWQVGISENGATLSFFRFDTRDELTPGLWVFEVWDGETRLYHAEFQVVPAAALPDMVLACGTVS